MNSNSDNPRIGKEFQRMVLAYAKDHFLQDFIEEKPVNIGNPPTPHKFDVVSADESIIIECKCYTWTEGGNVPSAKLATLDEAVLYMKSICHPAKKIIAMKAAENNGVSLAEYFCDKKGHLLGDISVWEFDDNGYLRSVREA